jgi:hypothetical protein
MNWSRYLKFMLGSALMFAVVIYAFILVLDPYQNVPFSPALNRAPVSTNQRFSYPTIARDPGFDSVVIGTSTSRLLDPRLLGELTGASFANLSMNSATAYEQTRLFELFLRHHPAMRFLVVGIDEVWCATGRDAEKYTFRDFPEWMYDENRWNDLTYLLNDKALEDAVRMFELLIGKREGKYRHDGYRDFTLGFPAWDEKVVGAKLREVREPGRKLGMPVPGWKHPDLDFGSLLELQGILQRLPATARTVLFLPPLHGGYIEAAADRLGECKGRLLSLLTTLNRTAMLDMMVISPATLDPHNYWDPLHVTRDAAVRLTPALARTLLRDKS